VGGTSRVRGSGVMKEGWGGGGVCVEGKNLGGGGGG